MLKSFYLMDGSRYPISWSPLTNIVLRYSARIVRVFVPVRVRYPGARRRDRTASESTIVELSSLSAFGEAFLMRGFFWRPDLAREMRKRDRWAPPFRFSATPPGPMARSTSCEAARHDVPSRPRLARRAYTVLVRPDQHRSCWPEAQLLPTSYKVGPIVLRELDNTPALSSPPPPVSPRHRPIGDGEHHLSWRWSANLDVCRILPREFTRPRPLVPDAHDDDDRRWHGTITTVESTALVMW